MKFRYPFREGHRVTLLPDGVAFFPVMLEAIDAARESIVLVIYQVAPGDCATRWCEALASAVKRGLEVYVLVDGFGAFPARDPLERLSDAGVKLAWFNPPRLWPLLGNLFRDHRKLLVVDADTGFIGGFCIADYFDGTCVERPWHDMVMRVEGPCVADMLAEFERDWAIYGNVEAIVPRTGVPRRGSARCRLVRNHPRGIREVRRSLHARLRTARERVWLVTPYFAPSRRLRRELRRAARRGVDVRLLLSGPETDQPIVRSAGWRHYGRLLRAGVRIFEYEGRCLHMKAVLVDRWVSAGSCNLDHWGMRWNRDLNLETDDASTVDAFHALLLSDFAGSRELTLAVYQGRSPALRFVQWCAAMTDVWIVRSAYRRQIRACRTHPGRPRRG